MKRLIKVIVSFIYFMTVAAHAQEQRLFANNQDQNNRLIESLTQREPVISDLEQAIIKYAKTLDVGLAVKYLEVISLKYKINDLIPQDYIDGAEDEKKSERIFLSVMQSMSKTYRALVDTQVRELNILKQNLGSAIQYQSQEVIGLINHSQKNREIAMKELSTIINQNHFKAALEGGAIGAVSGMAGSGVLVLSTLALKAFAVQVVAVIAGVALMATVLLAVVGFGAIIAVTSPQAVAQAKYSLFKSLSNFKWFGSLAGGAAIGFLIGSAIGYTQSKNSMNDLKKLNDDVQKILDASAPDQNLEIFEPMYISP